MHHAFTGSTRKARQVNLSGRGNTNPWANLPGSTKSSHTPPAAQSTVAHAQADRVRRQQERERLTASKQVQKTWRGHQSRRRQKAKWRAEWDKQEQDRLQVSSDFEYSTLLGSDATVPGYTSARLLLSQLRLLVHFQEFRQDIGRLQSDLHRVLLFGKALQESHALLKDDLLLSESSRSLAKLGRFAARHIKSIGSSSTTTANDQDTINLSGLIISIARLIPKQVNVDARLYMQVLRKLLLPMRNPQVQEAGTVALTSVLSASTAQSMEPYRAFAFEVLCDDLLSRNSRTLEILTAKLDLGLLSQAIASPPQHGKHAVSEARTDYDQQLWQMAYLIWMYRHVGGEKVTAVASDFIRALSALLSKNADAIASRFEVEDNSMDIDGPESRLPLPRFIKESLAYIIRQDFVRTAISKLTQPDSTQGVGRNSSLNSARHLADYAVSMLRAFPSKASDVRMWIYQSSILSSTGRSVSAVQFFWANTSRAKVFLEISQSHRKVMSALTEAAPESHQIGQQAVTAVQIQTWKEEWRIILLFLELYTFVLKIMDDDEFFSLDQLELQDHAQKNAVGFKRGALPLSDIASLTTFLKNMAFVLYWNAGDLAATNSLDDHRYIAELFGAPESRTLPPVPLERPPSQTLTGNGVSQAYLKDLTTGLLRMLHERDSRRNFLPKNHWLMTNQVDMTGFIPSVVAEEEKRHELGDDDDDEQDVDNLDYEDGPDAFTIPQLSSFFGIRQPHTPRSMASQQATRMERQRAQMRKKLLVQSLAPRLEILRNLPFFIPFEVRVQIFRQFVYRDQVRRRNGAVDPDSWRMHIAHTTQGRDVDGRPLALDVIGRQHAEIHRESVFEDAFASYYPLGEGLKEPIQISFIDKFGAPEAGIDGGGVTKEFLMSVTSEALDPNASLSMFQENDQRFLYPNPILLEETTEQLRAIGIKQGTESYAYNVREFLRRFEFFGRVIGKCLYEGILIDVNFAGFFLLKWALTGGSTTATTETSYRASINDLRDFDDQLYSGLLKLKNYNGDVENDFGLNFTINDEINVSEGKEANKTITHELIPKGSVTPVNNLNRHMYIDRVVRYRLQQQPQFVTNAFLKGLGQIIQPMWLAMFNQKELQKLIGGDNTELDISDLRRNTQYGGVYVIGDDGLEHPTVELFWKVMREMNDEDRRKVLKFVTSTPRAPLLGFSHLNPQFSIRDSSDDQSRLPSTSTCMNLLKLPRYGSKQAMKEKLLYAVNSGAGFDLS